MVKFIYKEILVIIKTAFIQNSKRLTQSWEKNGILNLEMLLRLQASIKALK